MEKFCLLAQLSALLRKLSSLSHTEPPAPRKGAAYNGLGPPRSITNNQDVPIDLLTVQPDLGIPSIESPFSGGSKVFQVDS